MEYESQSNDNADFLDPSDKFKFVDDLSLLEILNLVAVGLSSYNFYQHVASDIGVDQLYLPSQNSLSQNYMNNICEWTEINKMKLNEQKSKVMVFNFTKNYQFSTRVHLNNTLLEIIRETRLLGTIVSSDLTWHKNTQLLVQKGYQRMTMLRKLYNFDIPQEDLLLIYCLYIRSILEYNSNVWFSSITEEEKEDLERVQAISFRIILKEEYSDYQQALSDLNMKSLHERRQMLAFRFATKCTKSEKFSNLFPKNKPSISRNPEKYNVNFAKTGRLKKSSIPAMQRLLNEAK